MDIDNIPFGTDFRSHIQAVLQETEVLIVVIGPQWLGTDAAGAVRMSQDSDPVRAEIEAAQARSLPLIPVLVDGARMPASAELPASFKDFAFLNAAEVATGRDFHPHLDRLIGAIDRTVAARALADVGRRALVGASWTTDAPFRETEAAVAAARAKGVLAVEMEAAALYTFARQRNKAVLCLAHVTNTMGLAGQDFEKGEAQGAADALMILETLATAALSGASDPPPATS